jgi:Domain of unknown function (DUF222)
MSVDVPTAPLPAPEPAPGVDSVADAAAGLVAAFGVFAAATRVGVLTPQQLSVAMHTQEQVRRCSAGLDSELIAELSEQILVGLVPARDAKEFLVGALRLSPVEAAVRVRASVDLGPRRSAVGERLEPLFPETAAALAAGVISVEHARVIRRAITLLPPAVETLYGAVAERSLVMHARQLGPPALETAAYQLIAHLDPDGRQPSEAEHRRRRFLSRRKNGDGSSDWRLHATPELTAKADAVLAALTAPRAGEDDHPSACGDGAADAAGGGADGNGSAQSSAGHASTSGRDTRSFGQREHDALEEILDNMLRSGGLPAQGGLPATVSITVPLDVLEGRIDGVGTTSRGQDLSVQQLLRVASEAQLIWITVDRNGTPLDVGYTNRLCTPHIRRCVNVRDKGCVFPDCTIPPEWCEAHHVIPWKPNRAGRRGKTKVTNIALLCSFHHHIFEKWGWFLYMDHGHPWWIPPITHDPQQKPVQNTANHLPLIFLPEMPEPARPSG